MRLSMELAKELAYHADIESVAEALDAAEARGYERGRKGHPFAQVLDALKMAYRKHHMDDHGIGWDELSGVIACALQEAMGDDGFCAWVDSVSVRERTELDALIESLPDKD